MKKSNPKERVVEAPKFNALKENHENKWVAVTPDYKRVLGAGDNLSEVLNKTSQNKDKVIFKTISPLGYAPISIGI